MLEEENSNVFFIVETDTKIIQSPDDYRLEGYVTVLQKKEKQEYMVKIMAVIDEDITKELNIRNDLIMTGKFPLLWMEINRKNEEGLLVCGFSREWTHNENNS